MSASAFPGTAVPGKVWLTCGTTDMRKGFGGLAVLVQQVVREDPHAGAVFAFPGRRGDLVKLLWYDGQAYACSPSAWTGAGSCGR